jgi:hypothetical protein
VIPPRRRRASRAPAIVAALVVVVTAPRPEARAEEPTKKTSSLSFTRLEGAESCIGTHDLAQRVEGLLHRHAVVSAAEADLSIEGRAEKRSPKGFRATIVVAKSSGDIVGKREIETEEADCRSLDEPLALAMALMIDPDALAAPPTEPEPKKPEPPPPQVIVKERTVLVPVPVPEKPKKKKRRTFFEGYVSGVVGLGTTPVGGGVMTGAVVDPPWLVPLELSSSLLLAERSTPSYVAPGEARSRVGTLRFWQLEGALFACPLAGRRGLFFGALCAGGQAGFLASSGSGFAHDDAHLRPLVNAALRGRMGLWAFPFAITVGATGSVPFLRESFSYRTASGAEPVLFKSAPVAGLFDLSIGFKFPDPNGD